MSPASERGLPPPPTSALPPSLPVQFHPPGLAPSASPSGTSWAASLRPQPAQACFAPRRSPPHQRGRPRLRDHTPQSTLTTAGPPSVALTTCRLPTPSPQEKPRFTRSRSFFQGRPPYPLLSPTILQQCAFTRMAPTAQSKRCLLKSPSH